MSTRRYGEEGVLVDNTTINEGRSKEVRMWLWTSIYVKNLHVEKFNNNRHRRLGEEVYVNSKLKVEAKRTVSKEPKKAHGDRGRSSILDECGIRMRPYGRWRQTSEGRSRDSGRHWDKGTKGG